jgi:hypothetical protein
MDKKISFQFTPEDIAILDRLKAELEAKRGKASYVGVIRSVIRQIKGIA